MSDKRIVYAEDAEEAVIRHLQLDYDYAWGVREAINSLPSAQPEIRCKDCKHRGRFGYCTYGTRLAWIVGNDDFCSRAERRKK